MTTMDNYGKVVIDYTNWRGERRERTVRPVNIEFTSTHWHPEQQWIMNAEDGNTVRGFAMKDIHSWRPA
jgi:predicted DNA-binding transcriptional regulator YafY